MLLKNKTAVVTGCNRGIGKAILENFVENGANVFAVVRKESEDTGVRRGMRWTAAGNGSIRCSAHVKEQEEILENTLFIMTLAYQSSLIKAQLEAEYERLDIKKYKL